MGNLARFTIDGTPSSAPGFDTAQGGAHTFRLESPSGVIQRWSVSVHDPAVPDSPLSTLNAPQLALVGGTTGSAVDAATIFSAVTCTIPSDSIAASWKVRSVVNGGIDANGDPNPDYVFERIVSLRSASGVRKVIAGEATEYSPRGTADAQNEQADALATGAYSNITAPFTQPAVSGNVSVAVATTSWMAVGSAVFVTGGGYYTVVSVADSTHATLQNTGVSGNAAPATTVTSPARVVAGGPPGATGSAGTPGANGVGRSAVRAAQTAALPAFTYAAGVITCTANAALPAGTFDGTTLVLNDRVEINGTAVGANIAATTNGTYFVSQVGDGSHQPKFTRTADLNTTASFVGGVSYEVTEGNIYRGKRRYLATLGTIVLDTSQLLFDDIRSRDLLKIDTTQYPYSVRDQGADASDALNLALYNAQAAGFGAVELPHAAGILLAKPIKIPTLPELRGQGFAQTTFDTSTQGGGYRVIMGAVPEPPHGPVVDTNADYSLNLCDPTNPYWLNLSHGCGLYFNGDNDFDCSLIVRFGGSVSVGGTHIVSTRGRRKISDTLSEMHRITQQLGVVTAHLRTFAVVGGTPTYTSTSITSNVTMAPDTAYEIRHKYDATNGHRLWVTVLGAAYASPVSAADPHAAQSPVVTQFSFEETILGRGQNAGFLEDQFDLTCPGDATHGFYLGSFRYAKSLGNNTVSGSAPTTLGLGTGTKAFCIPCDTVNAVKGAYRDPGGALIAYRANGSWLVPNRADVGDTTGGHVRDFSVSGGGNAMGVAFRVRQCLQHSVRNVKAVGNNLSGMFVSGPSFYGFFETLRFLSAGKFGLGHSNCDFPHNGDTSIVGTYAICHYVGLNSGFDNSGSVFVDAEGSPDNGLVIASGETVNLGSYRISDESSSGYADVALSMVAFSGKVANVTAQVSCIQGLTPLVAIGSTSGYQGKVLLDCALTVKAANPCAIRFDDAGVAPVKLGDRFALILGAGATLTTSPGQIIGNGAIALADSDEVITCVQGDWRDLAAGSLATGFDRNKALSAALPATKGQAIIITWGVQAHALNVRNLTTGGTILYTAAAGTAGYVRIVCDGTNWARKEFSSQ